jgi:hypothetical protein
VCGAACYENGSVGGAAATDGVVELGTGGGPVLVAPSSAACGCARVGMRRVPSRERGGEGGWRLELSPATVDMVWLSACRSLMRLWPLARVRN